MSTVDTETALRIERLHAERTAKRRAVMIRNRKGGLHKSQTESKQLRRDRETLYRAWEARGVQITRYPGPNCDLCDAVFGVGKSKGPNLDHCHVTMKLRGWLCRKCNTGMGLLGDTAENMRRAAAYLDKCDESQQVNN